MRVKRLSWICAAIAIVALGCDGKRGTPPPPLDEPADEVIAWSPPKDVEPLLTADPFGGLKIGATRRLPECWESFITDAGAVADPFPFADDDERLHHLASCAPEGVLRLTDGALAVAFGGRLKAESSERDLVIAVWERDDGKLRFARRMNRSRQAPNWAANFRYSFITELPADRLCAGSLWEGDTQVVCMSARDGQPIWDGSLPFWSGIAPQSAEDGLVVADLSAMTKRYPYDGGEMKHRRLEGLGGRAGYYATDGTRLYFAPSRVDAPPLIAYDLQTFDELWRTPLPATPSTAVMEAYHQFDRVLIVIDGTLHAIAGSSGAIKWSYEIGADPPRLSADDDSIYVLTRQADTPNRLTALDPATGARHWSIETPAGTLRVEVVDGVLFIGSVRAVQRVFVAKPAPDAESADAGQ